MVIWTYWTYILNQLSNIQQKPKPFYPSVHSGNYILRPTANTLGLRTRRCQLINMLASRTSFKLQEPLFVILMMFFFYYCSLPELNIQCVKNMCFNELKKKRKRKSLTKSSLNLEWKTVRLWMQSSLLYWETQNKPSEIRQRLNNTVFPYSRPSFQC